MGLSGVPGNSDRVTVVTLFYLQHRMVANETSTAMKRTRRNHGATSKAQVALAACKGDKTLRELVEYFGMHPIQLTGTRRLLEEVADMFGGTTQKPDMLDPPCLDW